jgi:hypothetical protein
MKVICKNNSNHELTLTISKSYVIIESSNIGYRVIANDNRDYWYYKERFYTQSETRETILNDLGI